jgi:hypothetical protein
MSAAGSARREIDDTSTDRPRASVRVNRDESVTVALSSGIVPILLYVDAQWWCR